MAFAAFFVLAFFRKIMPISTKNKIFLDISGYTTYNRRWYLCRQDVLCMIISRRKTFGNSIERFFYFIGK